MPGSVNFRGNSDIPRAEPLRRSSCNGVGIHDIDIPDDASSVISDDNQSSAISNSEQSSLGSQLYLLESSSPSRLARLASAVFPKFIFFSESLSRSNHQEVAEKQEEAERWNKQIEQTIDQLKKKPQLGAPQSLNVQPDQADSGQPHLNVNVPPTSIHEPYVSEAAVEQQPPHPDFEALRGLFNTDSFPNFAHKIDLVHRTLSSDRTSLVDKIATLLSLKEKTDLFGCTATMINLAEALRNTARSGAEYKVADQTAEIEAEKETENKAIRKAEQALTKCQAEYEQQNVLLQDLLDLKNPVTDVTLRALYQRYLDISQDDENDTSFEDFTKALFDENNQYLNSLNDLVAASRQKVIDAHKVLDDVKALQHSEIEYDIFRRSPQSGLGNWFQTNTFVGSFTTFNGSLDKEQIGNFFDSIRSSLLDADQNKFMRCLVVTALVAAVILYPIAKIIQTTVAFGLALGATTVAAFAHAVYQFFRWIGVRLESKTYNVPKDEDQANKTRIADPARKLVIATHFANNPRDLAVKRVASSSILAPIPRRKRKVTNLSQPAVLSTQSHSLNAQSGRLAFQPSSSQFLGSSLAQSANVPKTSMLSEDLFKKRDTSLLKSAFKKLKASAEQQKCARIDLVDCLINICGYDPQSAKIAFRDWVYTSVPGDPRRVKAITLTERYFQSYQVSRSHSLNDQSESLAFQLSPSQVLGSSSSQSAYVSETPMLMDSSGNPMDDAIGFNTDYRISEYQSWRERNRNQANPPQPGSPIIIHSIPQNATTDSSLSITKTRANFAMGAQPQDMNSEESKSISELIRGISEKDSKEAYLNITNQTRAAVASNPTNLSLRARGHDATIRFLKWVGW